MKKTFKFFVTSFFVITMLSAFIFNSCGSTSSTGDGTIVFNQDTDTSTNPIVIWEGSDLFKSHYGVVDVSEFTIDIENCVITSGSFVVDMKSIKSSESEVLGDELASKLENHLMNEDFFDVERWPYASFELHELIEVDIDSQDIINSSFHPGIVSNKFEYKGTLKIKDVAKVITGYAYSDSLNQFYSVDFLIDRSDFNVKYASRSFFTGLGDKFIEDTIRLTGIINVSSSLTELNCL